MLTVWPTLYFYHLDVWALVSGAHGQRMKSSDLQDATGKILLPQHGTELCLLLVLSKRNPDIPDGITGDPPSLNTSLPSLLIFLQL